jgi:cytochrome c biogenesis protein CcdA
MTVVLSALGFIVGLYSIFVMQVLWNWFVAPTLHTSPISYWTMLGLNLFISMLIYRQRFEEKQEWEQVLATRNENETDRSKAGISNFAKIFINTMALGIGWTVHTFLASAP